ncbi:hypothetical protein PYCCODRAFT_1160682 [Trametes coccinea BRFM310]|uniref:Uncharacterized protein n=1 Tax=Trametes coccinea (strain BRFM310) TaxID=1353009 RepID=A0A1Y2IYG6_TRAC3|nr:hypothetical protein PYCCODRAFT_1160682 [Trametes coccinea BRFM310]
MGWWTRLRWLRPRHTSRSAMRHRLVRCQVMAMRVQCLIDPCTDVIPQRGGSRIPSALLLRSSRKCALSPHFHTVTESSSTGQSSSTK